MVRHAGLARVAFGVVLLIASFSSFASEELNWQGVMSLATAGRLETTETRALALEALRRDFPRDFADLTPPMLGGDLDGDSASEWAEGVLQGKACFRGVRGALAHAVLASKCGARLSGTTTSEIWNSWEKFAPCVLELPKPADPLTEAWAVSFLQQFYLQPAIKRPPLDESDLAAVRDKARKLITEWARLSPSAREEHIEGLVNLISRPPYLPKPLTDKQRTSMIQALLRETSARARGGAFAQSAVQLAKRPDELENELSLVVERLKNAERIDVGFLVQAKRHEKLLMEAFWDKCLPYLQSKLPDNDSIVFNRSAFERCLQVVMYRGPIARLEWDSASRFLRWFELRKALEGADESLRAKLERTSLLYERGADLIRELSCNEMQKAKD